MKRQLLPLYSFLLFVSIQSSAQIVGGTSGIENSSFQATRINNPPKIDGFLTDDCWEQAGEWSGTFTQQQPNEGKPATQDTRLKILYDNQNIYVAFRNYDSEPEKINRWLAPRDQVKGDAVTIIFDSYADKRTGFAFTLTAGGTRVDFLCQNMGNDDYSWNAVWQGKTSVDDKGWYAEFQIPLSQLRYSHKSVEQEWGFHAIRSIDRNKEYDHLHLIPRLNKGFVYSFATLIGISDLPKSKRIELTPYTSLGIHTSEKEEGNPYATGHEWNYAAGVDGKVGLSSDFTLDFTINPDFGQVEADPSTINLTAFETYFEEKRPFFLEGKNIFSMTGETMFYSRRIGSRPQWSPDEEDGRYSKIPQETNIITAVKVSGKSKRGLSLGVLNSITAKEEAKITENGVEYKMTAQPLTSYSVLRLQQDIQGGNTIVGGMFTSTNRSLREDHLSSLARNAYTGGLDFTQYFFKRQYYAIGSLQYSSVEGSKEAITALQESPVHYYQREEAPHIQVDSSRTNLRGSSGTIVLGRGGENKIVSEQIFLWRSPGFDLNDIGYLYNADYKLFRGYIAYIENTPKGIFRSYNIVPFYRFQWDYSNLYTFGRAGLESNMEFKNRWEMYVGVFKDMRTIETGLLRGGPPVLLNPRWGTDFSLRTDQSKKVWARIYHGTVLGSKRYAHFLVPQITYRPVPNLGLTLLLDYVYWNRGLEYVDQADLKDGSKAYIMSSLKHRTIGTTLRLDYSITPDLSVQFYGNPFISCGKYTEYKRATNTLDKRYENRFRLLDSSVLTYDSNENSYSLKESNNDAYHFDNPDFSFREFRFNLVARWEYRPNSTVYLVWGQERSGSESTYISSFKQNSEALFGYHPNNVFMVKLNYWFSL